MTTPPRPWKAIVFDFDGTLAELNIDFPGMRRGVLALASSLGIPTGPIQSLHVLEMIEAAAAALGESRPGEVPGFLRDARTLVEGIEIAAAESGALFSQTRPLLAGLRERSVRTGIITRNCRNAVLRLFPDIGQYCQAFLSRDDVGRVKPHPDHLEAALKILEVPPSETMVVGDSVSDMQGAKELNVYAVGLTTGISSEKQLMAAGATRQDHEQRTRNPH